MNCESADFSKFDRIQAKPIILKTDRCDLCAIHVFFIFVLFLLMNTLPDAVQILDGNLLGFAAAWFTF